MVVLLGACAPKDKYADRIKSWRVKELRQLAFKHGKPSKDPAFLGYLSKETNRLFYLLAFDHQSAGMKGKVFIAADKNSVCTRFGYIGYHYSGQHIPWAVIFHDQYEFLGKRFCDVYVKTGPQILEDAEAETFANGVLSNLKSKLNIK